MVKSISSVFILLIFVSASLQEVFSTLLVADEFAKHIRETEPLSPEEERRSFSLPEGFEVTLVAAEPDIAKPMNIAFDSRGRLWVTCTTEYPYAAPDDRPHQDSIKVLEDTDGNGTFDRITTFADQLNIPIGLYPYRDGAICFSIPNVLYLRDTDGDLVADHREVLYGPFDTTRDTHGMCNAFRRAHDGWLYACHGFNNQSTVAGTDGHSISMRSGNTFRMRVDGSRIEHFTFGQVNPFGMSMTLAGDLFTADCHTKPITLLMRGGYSESFGAPHDGLGFVPPVMDHLHGSTAIGGIAIYQADQFPPEYRNCAYSGNVMTSRVNRNLLQYDGGTVSAKEQPDFLIAKDPWFRPVDLQVGPDGALYIADFYNRIIGHYEVPLNHPGRDRHRGRIWKVVHHSLASEQGTTLTRARQNENSAADLIARLSSSNLSRSLTAVDRLVDEHGAQVVPAVRDYFFQAENDLARIHAAWVLFRLNAFTDQELHSMMHDEEELPRVHAQKLIEADLQLDDRRIPWIQSGLRDNSRLVRRAAAMAAAAHPHPSLLKELVGVIKEVPQADRHLRHALRLAMRNNLAQRERFEIGMQSIDPVTLAELSLAIKEDFAADFVVSQLASLAKNQPQRFGEFLTFAARYATPARLSEIAAMVQSSFPHDFPFQEGLAYSVRDGLRQRGMELSPELQHWAKLLACARWKIDPQDEQARPKLNEELIAWTYIPHPAGSLQDNPWVIVGLPPSSQTSQANGRTTHPTFTSIAKGEQRTGIYRSNKFTLPQDFSFYLAGHDGYPDKPLNGQNWVRICDGQTRQVLQQWQPPRNDVAQPIHWESGTFAGREVYLELVDGNTDGAFAWLAVSRFSVSGLNPSSVFEDWRRGAILVKDFRIRSLQPVLVDLLQHPNLDRSIAVEVARGLIDTPSGIREAIAESLAFETVSGDLRNKVIEEVTNRGNLFPSDLMMQIMRVCSRDQQRQLAIHLSTDPLGVKTLLEGIEKGCAARNVLKDATVAARLSTVADPALVAQCNRLMEDLPQIDPQREKLVAHKKMLLQETDFREVSLDAGGKLFQSNCANCHQVRNQGNPVGPNLDGIGNRGLLRLVEDVLLPHQNVDLAFTTTVVVMDDGTVRSGFARREEGAQLLMVDGQGKEFSIPMDSIEHRKRTNYSPMPDNFAELLSDRQIQELYAFLLSLN